MAHQTMAKFICLLLMTTLVSGKQEEEDHKDSCWPWTSIGLGIAGGIGIIAAAPVVLTGLGFTAAGVAAGSIASGLMAANGPIAAGSVYAALQSAGAAGLGLTAKVVIGGIGSTGAYNAAKLVVDECAENDCKK